MIWLVTCATLLEELKKMVGDSFMLRLIWIYPYHYAEDAWCLFRMVKRLGWVLSMNDSQTFVIGVRD